MIEAPARGPILAQKLGYLMHRKAALGWLDRATRLFWRRYDAANTESGSFDADTGDFTTTPVNTAD